MTENKYEDLKLADQATEEVYGDDWTNTAQKKLEAWKVMAAELAARHDLARRRWTRIRDSLHLPSILLSAASGLVLGLNQYYQEQYFRVVALGIAGVDIFVKGIYYNWSASERCEQHEEVSNAYAALVRAIDYQLYIPPKKRPDIEVAYVQVTSAFDAIGARAPPL